MPVETQTQALRVTCPHCNAVNRLLAERAGDAPVCGACRKPLFGGHPVALDEAAFDRTLVNSDIPVIVDFWAPWCAPCRAMAPVFERAAAELEPRARLAKVNTDEAQALAQRLGIRGIPTLAIFRGGREVARTSGATDLRSLLSWVERYI